MPSTRSADFPVGDSLQSLSTPQAVAQNQKEPDAVAPPVGVNPLDDGSWAQSSFDNLVQWLSTHPPDSGKAEQVPPTTLEPPFNPIPDPAVPVNHQDIPGGMKAERDETNHKHPLFPARTLQDFKHVLYNLMAEAHNNPDGSTLLLPYSEVKNGVLRHGFRFNPDFHPEKKMAELYALYIRKCRLDLEDQNSVFIQDLYKFYCQDYAQ